MYLIFPERNFIIFLLNLNIKSYKFDLHLNLFLSSTVIKFELKKMKLLL